ncbi:MAG: type II toxin-antitoxin system PemK/MazF family toxin [Acetobacteraceae bacterium]|nr:type II toxin-antitoxin system PemK/MazF family toxin [Acetobacteraceae bacterium]MBV8615261.1 type II toxin-antitoxin system PemK/MazF family toxin [Acetobacteraceae bacterium]
MRRGDLLTVALRGDYGEPRAALVVQSDWLDETDSVLVCLLTTTLRNAPFFRLSVAADQRTGLREPSQLMVDKIMAVRRDRCGPRIGRLGPAEMQALNRLLALVLGIVD